MTFPPRVLLGNSASFRPLAEVGRAVRDSMLAMGGVKGFARPHVEIAAVVLEQPRPDRGAPG